MLSVGLIRGDEGIHRIHKITVYKASLTTV